LASRLGAAEAARYDVLKDEFERGLLTAQQQNLKPGQTFRKKLRVPCSSKVRVALDGRLHEGLTVDLSALGFGAFLGATLAVGAPCEVEIVLQRQSVHAFGRIATASSGTVRSSLHRTSVVFERLDPPVAARIADYVLNAALASFKG
jgi:hypothetical protein